MRGHKIAYYHLELTHTSMEDRMMARHSNIPLWELEMKGYAGIEVSRAIDSIRKWQHNLIYIHCPGWAVGRIVGDIMRLNARGECDLAIVDYLNKIPLDVGNRNEASAIGNVVEALKTTAENLEIPMVLACQLNREYKGKARPRMDDVKGSSDIEQRANQVVILHRAEERQPGNQHGKVEPIHVFVDKNTSGPTGKCIVNHRMGLYRLEGIEQGVEEIPWDFEEA